MNIREFMDSKFVNVTAAGKKDVPVGKAPNKDTGDMKDTSKESRPKLGKFDKHLDKHGYKYQSLSDDGENSRASFKHGKHGDTVDIDNSGAWKHQSYNTGNTTQGNGANSLAKHLAKIHAEEK